MELYTFKTTYLFLEEIRKNETLRSYLSTEFPPLTEDLESFSKNANCSCRNRIIAYLSENINSEKMQAVLSNLSEIESIHKVELNEKLTLEQVKTAVTKTSAKPMVPKSGEIVLFHNTEKLMANLSTDWKALMDLAKKENWNYKGVTVYTEGNSVYALFY